MLTDKLLFPWNKHVLAGGCIQSLPAVVEPVLFPSPCAVLPSPPHHVRQVLSSLRVGCFPEVDLTHLHCSLAFIRFFLKLIPVFQKTLFVSEFPILRIEVFFYREVPIPTGISQWKWTLGKGKSPVPTKSFSQHSLLALSYLTELSWGMKSVFFFPLYSPMSCSIGLSTLYTFNILCGVNA